MKRRWFAVLGAAFFLANLAVVVAFPGDLTSDPATALRAACYLVAALLFIVGGSAPSVGSVAWYRFVGAGVLLVGVVWVVRLPVALVQRDPATTGDLLSLGAVAVGGLVLVLIGVDWFRGGRNFDLPRVEDGPLLGA